MEQLSILFEAITLIIFLPAIFLHEIIALFKNLRGVDRRKLQNLDGKVVLIIGASSGIGESLSKHFYVAGCKLILAARRINELERVQASLTALHCARKTYPPVILELDLSKDSKSIAGKAEAALAIHGDIDILINNAGVMDLGSVLDNVMDVDEHVTSVNYLGTLALTKVIGRHMVNRKQGHITFICSVLGKFTITVGSAYSASKHAVQALADSLRLQVADQGVKVTIISPSYVQTDIDKNALTATGDKHGKTTKELKQGYSCDYICEKIFKAVVNQQKDVVIAPFSQKLAIYGRNFLPSLLFFVLRTQKPRCQK